MIKYFHELTEPELKVILKNRKSVSRFEKDYPQPKWCNYPEATRGLLGCWSLVGFMVTSEDYCKNCEFRSGAHRWVKINLEQGRRNEG